MLNHLTRCFNAKKEEFSSTYLLITEIYTYWKLWRWHSSTKNLKKQQQQDGNICFMFTIIFVHKIMYCDQERCIWTWHLSGFMFLCSLVWVVVKWVLHRKCIGKFHSFLLVVPIEGTYYRLLLLMLFVTLPICMHALLSRVISSYFTQYS